MGNFWSLFFVLLVFALILVSSRKMELGYALFLGALLLALFFRMDGPGFLRSVYAGVFNTQTGVLVASIFLALILSEALKNSGQMEVIVKTCLNLLHDIRMATFVLPALIGLLPMPGGAYFSAPMVETALQGTSLGREKKLFANYWFRHVWEYINPLYPGIVATVALTGLDFRELVRFNVWLSLAAIVGGAFIVFFLNRRSFPAAKEEYAGSVKQARSFLLGVFPVVLVLILVIFSRLTILPALVAGLAAFFLLNRFTLKDIGVTVKQALSLKMLLLLLGIVVFKEVLGDSGAVEQVAFFLRGSGIGLLPVIFGLSFLSGLVTGITIAFVGLSLPIILPLLDEVSPGVMMFVFAAGFGGVLLSPVHLCLVITNQYFKTRLVSVYRYLLPATLLVMVVGYAGYRISLL